MIGAFIMAALLLAAGLTGWAGTDTVALCLIGSGMWVLVGCFEHKSVAVLTNNTDD